MDPSPVETTVRATPLRRTGFRAPRRAGTRVLAPGHIRAWSSNRHVGVVLAGFGLVFGLCALGMGWANGSLGSVWIFELMATLVAGIGLALPTERSLLEIHPGAVRLARWVRWKKRGEWTLSRDSVQRIRLSREIYRGDRRTRVTYPVSVVLAAPGAPSEVVVHEGSQETASRRRGEELARELAIPLEDALGTEPEIRSPEALDRRVERAADPGAPSTAAVRILPSLWPEVEIRGGLRGRQAGAALVGGAVLFAGAPLVIGLQIGSFGEGWLTGLSAAVLAVAEISVVGVLLSPFLGRHRLRIENGTLHHELRLGRLRLRHDSLAASAVEQVRIDGTSPLGAALTIVADQRVLRIQGGFDRPTLDWLRSWLAHRIGS